MLIADTRTAKGTAAVFGSPDMPAAALYAPIDFVKKNPNTVQALTNSDYPVILAITLIGSFLVMLSNLLVDVLYPLLDPRAADTTEGR